MKYTTAIAVMRNRLASVGVPPDSVIAGQLAYRDLVRECTCFRTTHLSGLRRYEDLKDEEVVPITKLFVMDLEVYESPSLPPEALYVGVGLKP